MKKILFFSLLVIFCACSKEKICLEGYKSLRQGDCNMFVEENINKSSTFAEYQLNLKGRDITTNEEVIFKPNPRGWEGYYGYINIGDTVVKKEGEPVIYVLKKDSILKISFENFCDDNFDFDKVLSVTLRKDKLN